MIQLVLQLPHLTQLGQRLGYHNQMDQNYSKLILLHFGMFTDTVSQHSMKVNCLLRLN